jgi:hypothetical protein
MQTVVETPSYLSAAKAAGLEEATRQSIISEVARNSELGDAIQGTGGFRKFRFRLPGRGKSGGIRVITLFTGPSIPVFLIDVFAKGNKANLTRAERNELAKLSKVLVSAYNQRAKRTEQS